MIKRFLSFLIAVVILSGIAAAVLYLAVPSRDVSLANLTGDADRGAYVLRLGGCVTCHTKHEGGKFLGGGDPIETPFGSYYPPNITPDETFGIGSWSTEEFVQAVLNGRAPDGRHYAPTFPFTSYVKMSEQDVVDLWAYLKTVETAPLKSTNHDLAPAARIPFAMGIWKTLGFDPTPFAADPNRSDIWNRGAYIVNGPGHCGECHTPRDRLGRTISSAALSGTILMPSKEKVPPITTSTLRERGWNAKGMVLGFKFGFMPDGDVLGGSMGEVIRDDLSHLTDDDINAIATYLLDE